MSDKKEVTELSIKVSVDTTELDKLEAQLRRISGLMVNVGIKKPASGGFVTHYINIDNGQAYFNGASLKAADITHLIKQELEEVARVKKAEDEALIIALKKAVEKSLIYVARSNANGV
ncbi:hypothetical protein [Providencia alcalifaciens]|uniref:hypothetical protein n=1 Tax=Providencia alcalifaciens TaxID=126385 RepID=UPI000D9089D5|nr:hypothetical protein [Providencia alcalifaciens]MTC29137.1 hypothetical protein [Providencia alcalifaciens]SPY68044.1 Uncharacterised protein [Providencia alcalifaciens]